MSISNPSYGSAFSDGVRVGAAFPRLTEAPGVKLPSLHVYDVVPLAANAANVVASVTALGAGYLTLAAGTGTTLVSNATSFYNGCIQLDCSRGLQFVSAGNDSAVTFTIYGYDVYGQLIQENVAGANVGTAVSVRSYLYIKRIYTNAATTSTLTVGTNDLFGLPYYLAAKNYIVAYNWNSTLGALSTVVAGVTTTPSATTGDTRGTITPANASDGAKRLTVFFYVSGASSDISSVTAGVQTQATLIGVTPYFNAYL